VLGRVLLAAALTSVVHDARKQGFERVLDGPAEGGQRRAENEHDDDKATRKCGEPNQHAHRREHRSADR
jgi:hypothetical protein